MFHALIRALVRHSAPPARRDMIVDDLEEEWAERIQPQVNGLRAELWYIREGSSLIAAFARARLRDPSFRIAGHPTPSLSGGPMRTIGKRTDWILDARHALRGLIRSPAFTAAAVMTLAIGIGGTIIMSALAHSAFLRPLPYPDAEHMMRVFTGYEHDLTGRNAISPLTWQDALDRPDVVSTTEVWEPRSMHLTEDDRVRRVTAARVSTGLLPLMGATPVLGRLFVADESVLGNHLSVVLSHRTWSTTFGTDPSIVGSSIVLDDVAYQVVGVANPSFDLPRGVELWIPLALGPEWYAPGRRGWEFLQAVAVLSDGATPQAAGEALTQQLARVAPDRVADVGQRVNVVPIREHLVAGAGSVLLAMLGAVFLVLLIGGANVMNLILARAESRRHEFALRRALGISTARLAQFVVLETFVLCTVGGVVGLTAAVLVLRLLAAAPPEVLGSLPFQLGWEVLGFAAVLIAVPAVLLAIVPTIGALSTNPQDALQSSVGRTSGSRAGSAVRSTLVIAEVALAVLLVFGVGLTAASFHRLTAVQPGFEPGDVLAVNLETPAQGYDMMRRADVYQRIVDRVNALPGVSRAGLTYALPLTGVQWSGSFELVQPDPSIPDAALGGNIRPISPAYLEIVGIPVIEGRTLTDTDGPDAPPVVLVDETMARRVWPGRSPVGQQIDLGVFASGDRVATVVGVVGSVHDRSLSTPPSAHMYYSVYQGAQRRMVLVAQPTISDLPLATMIRDAVAEVEPRMPVYDAQPLSSVVSDAVSSSRISLLLMVVFASTALLLAAVGVYGVLSYTVSARTREIGTRIALGATPSAVTRLVLGRVGLLWLIGGTIGGATAVAVRSIASGLVYDVDPGNPIILGGAVLCLGLIALVAGAIPARRAATMDCVEALRRD